MLVESSKANFPEIFLSESSAEANKTTDKQTKRQFAFQNFTGNTKLLTIPLYTTDISNIILSYIPFN